MSVDYDLMRSIHRMLRQLSDIAERLRKGPMKQKLAKSNETAFEAALEEAKAKHKQTQLASRAKQGQLDDREAKIEDMKSKLNAADSNKEFQLLKDRIAADEQANSVLSDEILELLEKLDVEEAEIKTATDNLNQSKADTEKINDQVESERKSLTADQQSITADLKVAKGKLDRDSSAHFDRLIKIKGEETFAETNTETCGNCHQRITSQTVNELLLKKAVFCKGCDAILYLAETHPHSK